jgi:hypothetical protein
MRTFRDTQARACYNEVAVREVVIKKLTAAWPTSLCIMLGRNGNEEAYARTNP